MAQAIQAIAFALSLASSPDVARLPELWRFPDAGTAHDGWRAAVEYCHWLGPHVGLNSDVPEFGWERHERSARTVAECWSELDDAHRALRYHTSGGLAAHLDRLKQLIGAENYAAGRMPAIHVAPH